MLIYNAFPLAYENCDQITQQLSHLHYMGFQVVWLNPIQYCRRYEGHAGGSLYSMSNEDRFISQWWGGDVHTNERALQNLKAEANRLGLTLMFDLVMNQVGRALPKIYQHLHLFVDANKGQFDYSSEQKRIEIFNVFFRPMIQRYVVNYGFTGMRIDAAGVVPPQMQKLAVDYFRELCWTHHHTNGIVLGEYLEGNDRLNPLLSQGVSYDLITNSSYWSVNPSPYFDPQKRASHNGEMCERRQLARTYGTMGWTGNHDMKNLYHTCHQNLPTSFYIPEPQKNQMLKKMMRERIAVMALISDGGYYMLCGDEFGSPQRRNCFEWEGHEGEPALRPGETFHHKWGGKFEMTEFIKNVNLIRKQLPLNVDPHFWSEQYVVNSHLDPHQDVKCIVRNNGSGFSGSMDIIFVNVNPNEHVFFNIDNRFVENIKHQIKSCHPEFDLHKPIRVYFAGSFNMCGDIPHECHVARPSLEPVREEAVQNTMRC